MVADAAFPKDPPTYPKYGTYADLLNWHLYVWGTRHSGSSNRLGELWEPKEFREAIFGACADDEINNKNDKNIRNWLGAGAPPKIPAWMKRIEQSLFGESSEFTGWKEHLRAALLISRRTGNNEFTVNLETARAYLLRAGLSDSATTSANDDSNQSLFATAPREHANFVPDRLKDFFGRDDHVRDIDALVDASVAGTGPSLLVITAPAGFGKSAFAVHWCDLAAKRPGRKIAKHFCSFSSGSASNAVTNVYDHLHWQVAQALGQPLRQSGSINGLMDLLRASPPEGEALIVWLDGIDEAEGTVECFLPKELAHRICVIVSARSNDNIVPAYLAPWLKQDMAKAHRAHRHSLTKLSEGDVGKLVDGLFAKDAVPVPANLAWHIYRASDGGYALFARFMAEDAVRAAGKSEAIELCETPETLHGYAKRELERLEALDRWSEFQALFSFLTIAKDAVPINELPILLGHPCKRINPSSLPYTLRRWLSVTEASDAQSALLSFAHPLLADVFGRALGSQSQDAHNDLCDSILAYPVAQWPHYALRHIPTHLLHAARCDVRYHDKAFTVLTDQDFINGRFMSLRSEGDLEVMRLMFEDWLAWLRADDNGHMDNYYSIPMQHFRDWRNRLSIY